MRRDIGYRLVFSLMAAALLLSAGTAHAQAQLQVPVQFDFLNPGARSMALGSAFVGLADDATAAFTNPAGLDRLVKPEVSFEVRGRRFDNAFLQGGRLSGTPSGRGIDTIGNAVYGEAIDSTAGLSFLSFVYPGRRWAVSGYRHELVRVSQSFEAQGVFLAGLAPGGVPNNNVRELPLQAARDLDITNFGGAFAFKATDTLSVGGGVSVYRFKVDATFRRFLPPSADFFGRPEFTAQREFQLVTQEGSNQGVGFNVGVLFKAHPKVQIGAVYRKGPDFEFAARNELINPATLLSDDSVRFQAPDAFSVGASFRPSDALLVTAEYDFVAYSMLEEEYVTHVSRSPSITHPDQFSIEDSNEFHVGVEWTLTKVPRTPSLRFGAWHDPAHGVVYDRSPANDTDDVLFSGYAPRREDVNHFTFGGGLPVSERFELNAGADLSSRSRLFSVSAVVRF